MAGFGVFEVFEKVIEVVEHLNKQVRNEHTKDPGKSVSKDRQAGEGSL
jgi:hypothetical protein